MNELQRIKNENERIRNTYVSQDTLKIILATTFEKLLNERVSHISDRTDYCDWKEYLTCLAKQYGLMVVYDEKERTFCVS